MANAETKRPQESAGPASLPAAAARSAWQRRLGILLLLLLVLALVSEMFWFAPLDQTAAAPPRTPASLPLAAVAPFGAHVFLEREVDRFKKDKTADLLAQSGLRWVRQEFPWSDIQFKRGDGGYFDEKNNVASWAKYDDIVRQATSSGLQVVARLDRAPDWARRPPAQPGLANFGAPPARFSDFGDFVAAFVRHYKGQIHFLQIWNEPNLEGEWDNGKPVNPAEYVALLKEAATRARAVDPDIVILSAPLAPTNENFELNPHPCPAGAACTHNLRETVYLDEMYAAGAAPYFDITAANAFGYNDAPEVPPAPDTYNFRRVELLRAVMERHSDTQKPVWITEYAWDAPDANAVDAAHVFWGHVTLEQQADYTVRGVRYAREHWPWAGVFSIWYFRQVGDILPKQADYYFAMVSPDFVPQPIYRAVQQTARDFSLAEPGVYGPLAAPLRATPGWGLQIVREGPAGTAPAVPLLVSAPIAPALGTSATGATLTITFRGTDLTLLLGAPAATSAAGPAPRLYLTVDGGVSTVAPGLARDAAGHPYLDSSSGTPRAPGDLAGDGAVVPLSGTRAVRLVAGLGSEKAPAVHQVQLRAEGAGMRVAGFVVASERSYLVVSLVTGLLIVLLGVDVVFTRRRRDGRGA